MTDFSKHMPKQAEVNEKAVQAAEEFLQALGLDLKQLGMEKHRTVWLWPFPISFPASGRIRKTAGAN